MKSRFCNAGSTPAPPSFDATTKVAKIMSPPEVVDAILADLDRLDPRRRRFTRYLTLSHLASAGRSASDLASDP